MWEKTAMTSRSSKLRGSLPRSEERDLAEFGVNRFRDIVFDAVLTLWRRRHSEGLSQKELGEAIGRDPGWVSRNLRAPGNWTMRTAGELIQALNGEAEVSIAALEDAPQDGRNYDAYDGYYPVKPSTQSLVVAGTESEHPTQFTIGSPNPVARARIGWPHAVSGVKP